MKIKWNKGAMYRLRSEPGIVAELRRYSHAIADTANRNAGLEDGFRTSSMQGARKPYGRWRTTVITATDEAIRDNAKYQTLVLALMQARD